MIAKMNFRLALFALVLLFVPACGIGTIPTVPFGTLPADYARPMVAKKSNIPVLLVDETTNVPDAGETKSEYPIPYTGLTSFVSRDIKGALDLYFSDVKVVKVEEVPTEAQALIVNVRVDSLGYDTSKATSSSGHVAQTNYPFMRWALGIKAVNGDEYIFSFSGTSVGSKPFATKSDLSAAYQALLGSAVSDFLKGYIEKGIQPAILAAEEAEGAESVEEDDAEVDEAEADE